MKRSPLLLAAVASVVGAMLALSKVFTTAEWFWPALWSIPIAFGMGRLSRRLDVPAFLAPAVYAVGLLLFTGLWFFRDTLMAGIPSLLTLRMMGDSLGRAFTDVRELAAPIEVNPDVTLLTVGGVFVIAALVDQIVFALRRPVAAGLPLLALYIVPASLAPDGMGVWPFVVAAAGYIGLLIAEGRERVGRWGGRVVGLGVVDEVRDVTPVARIGRRLGAAAVAVALVVPAFLPDLGEGLLGGTGAAGLGDGKGGGGRINVINPIVQLKGRLVSQDNTELLRVATDHPSYLRLTSLDVFRNDQWTQEQISSRDRVEGDLGPAPGLDETQRTTTVTSSIQVRDFDSAWLPAPYAPRRVTISDGDWRYERDSLTIFSVRAKANGMSYTVVSEAPDCTAAELDALPAPSGEALERYRQLPGPPSARARAVLAAATKGATTPYEKVLGIQEWLRDNGTYDISISAGSSLTDLESFLNKPVGYCEQFAATMAYLVRVAELPSRVAIGFTYGTPTDDGEGFSVANRDAHAWPEVYFEGAGWVPFEPTPGGAAEARPAYAIPASETPVGPGAQPTPQPTTPVPTAGPESDDCVGSPQQCREELENQEPADTGTTEPTAAASNRRGTLVGAVLVLAMLALAAPVSYRTLSRWRRRRLTDDGARAEAAWACLAEDAEDVGLPFRVSDSPRGAARRLVEAAELADEPAAAVATLVRVVERARYAPHRPEVSGLDDAVRVVRRALLEAAPRRQRLRAMLLPPSAARRLRLTGGGLTGRVIDGWDALVQRVLRLLPWRRAPV